MPKWLAILALLIAGNPAAYAKGDVLPKPDPKKTQEMSALALGAFKRYGLKESGGYPELRIVDRTHEMLGGKRHARAVIYETGPPAVYLSRRAYTTRR